VLLLNYLPRKDERLSWPSWLTCSGRITHIVVTRWLQAEHRTGSVRRPKTDVLPTVLCNQPSLSLHAALFVVFWLSSSTLVSLSEVNLHRAKLVLGWVTVSGFSSKLT